MAVHSNSAQKTDSLSKPSSPLPDDPELGGITFKNLITLLTLFLFGYALVAFFPVVSLPFDLKNEVKSLCLDYLRQTPGMKAQADNKKQAKGIIMQGVVEKLEGHIYDEKQIQKGITIEGTRHIRVVFDYTIVIDYLGMEFTFDKNFEHSESLNF